MLCSQAGDVRSQRCKWSSSAAAGTASTMTAIIIVAILVIVFRCSSTAPEMNLSDGSVMPRSARDPGSAVFEDAMDLLRSEWQSPKALQDELPAKAGGIGFLILNLSESNVDYARHGIGQDLLKQLEIAIVAAALSRRNLVVPTFFSKAVDVDALRSIVPIVDAVDNSSKVDVFGLRIDREDSYWKFFGNGTSMLVSKSSTRSGLVSLEVPNADVIEITFVDPSDRSRTRTLPGYRSFIEFPNHKYAVFYELMVNAQVRPSIVLLESASRIISEIWTKHGTFDTFITAGGGLIEGEQPSIQNKTMLTCYRSLEDPMLATMIPTSLDVRNFFTSRSASDVAASLPHYLDVATLVCSAGDAIYFAGERIPAWGHQIQGYHDRRRHHLHQRNNTTARNSPASPTSLQWDDATIRELKLSLGYFFLPTLLFFVGAEVFLD